MGCGSKHITETVRMLVTEAEAGPSRISAADKWVKPNGPPVEVPFGARLLTEDQDVWTHNTWSALL